MANEWNNVARRNRFASVLSVLAIMFGVVLLAGGGWLLALDGSPYYVLAGVGFAVAGGLIWSGRAEALAVYALLFVATLIWALWETGLDWWPLAARLGLPFTLGVLLLLPATSRNLHGRHGAAASWRLGSGLTLSLALGAFAVVAVASWLRDPYTRAGRLPAPAAASATQNGTAPGDWPAYGRTGLGQRYSPLTQITTANVKDLKLAWEFHTGDRRGHPGDPEETTFEVTPLKIGNRLVLCTPHQSVIALDAVSGHQLWRYDPQIERKLALQHLTCRGLGYQPPTESDASTVAASNTNTADIRISGQESLPVASATEPTLPHCASQLFMPTADGRLIALDPQSGAVCKSFGNGRGQIDLWANMPNLKPGSYYSTSPPVVARGLVIVAGTVIDNASIKEQSGVIRAFDVKTGALVWNWDSGKPDATAPIAVADSYTPNSPNSWSVSSVDEALGLVYVPMGNQPPDQWGGQRSSAVERYSSSVVALDLATGRARWVFQTVHHDLWDYDVPAQPILVDLKIGGQPVPALVQPTKQGEIFVLDRRTGKPLLPVSEVPVPQGAATGDHSAPTQPKSAISFEPPSLAERDMWGVTPLDQLWCRIAFHGLRYEGRFTPPTTQGSLVNPGNFGVFNWGSIAVDPVRHIAFTTPDLLAFTSQLVPRADDRTLMVQDSGPPKGSLPALNENFGAPFASRMKPFLSPLGVPCQAPPWGTVAGVDLDSGHVVWRHRNGTVRDLSPLPLPLPMGVPNLGGPIITAGGVAFLSGTMDYYVRAYDVDDGRELWESRLPAGGQATPMTYSGADGRQYLLVVAGGHGSTGTKPGDSVLAYALPKP